MIGCLGIAVLVALALSSFGAPTSVFAFVILCALMTIAAMFFTTNAIRPHDRAKH
jgi:hypothetical protein